MFFTDDTGMIQQDDATLVPQTASGDDSGFGGTQSADPAQGGANKKSPMDILEEILKESEQEESAEAAAAAAAAKEEADKEAEKAAKIAAYEQALAEQKAKDEALISERLTELQSIENTPENQARLQQIAQAQEQQEQAAQASEGFEIVQIDHAKIPVADQ